MFLCLLPRSSDKELQKEAEAKKETFLSEFGDHVALLFLYDCWSASGFSQDFCSQNFVHYRIMKK